MKSKVLLVIAILLAAFSIKVFWWDAVSAKKEITNAFLTKNYTGFLNEVAKNKSSFSEGQQHLLLAYGYRATGNYKKADAELVLALQQNGNTPSLNLEIVLNQTLNAYVQDDLIAFANHLDQIDVQTETAREWKKLFQGVEALKVEDCNRALKFFNSPLKLEALNPIMHQAFTEKLPPSWTLLQVAQCEMGMGRYEEARDRITGSESTYAPSERELAHLLLGKSYLLEGNEKEVAESAPYYSSAMIEIRKVTPKDYLADYHHIKYQLISALQVRLQKSLLSGDINKILFFENALNLYQQPEIEKVHVVAESPKHKEVEEIDEWAFETPLDLNYVLIQRRIDSILDGEKQLASTKHQMEEDARFLTLLTQINPPLTPVFFLLGQVELLLHEDYKAALALARYVELDPDDIWGWKLLALAQLGAEDTDSAIDSFLEVIKINPVDLAAWKSLGKIYQAEGKKDLAIRAFEKARTMDPFDDEVISSLNHLYTLR